MTTNLGLIETNLFSLLRNFGFFGTNYMTKISLIKSYLESCGAPVDKLNGSLCFDRSNGGIHVLGYNITSIQHTTGHIFPMTWVALHHLQILINLTKLGVGERSFSLFVQNFLLV